jgi:hypothetical protein
MALCSMITSTSDISADVLVIEAMQITMLAVTATFDPIIKHGHSISSKRNTCVYSFNKALVTLTTYHEAKAIQIAEIVLA